MNLIILCFDELRSDCAGFMGNDEIQTPNMDRVAERGVVFDQHYASFPKCVPARCSLMTGRYCHTDGWRTVSQTLEQGQADLFGSLQARGYQTAVFGKNHCWHATQWDSFDFTSSKAPFDGWRDRPNKDKEQQGERRLDLDDGWHYIGSGTRHVPDVAYAEHAAAFLREQRDPNRPFAMQLNFESPHPKYGVEEPWFSMYDREAIRAWPHDLPANAPLPVTAQRDVRTGNESNEAAVREVQATYYGMVSKVDHLLGKVLAAIDEQDLWKDTVVLLWSDHGDYAGQYGLAEKWDTHFSDCLVHVPLVIAAPGWAGGTRSDALSDTTDLAPTLCELLGIDPLPGMHGRSMVPAREGTPIRNAVFSEGGHETNMRQRYEARGRPIASDGSRMGKSETYWKYPDSMARAQMVRTATHKLVIRETGGNEFYDLAADPWEMHNRYDEPGHEQIKADLTRRLVAWNLATLPDRPYLENFTV